MNKKKKILVVSPTPSHPQNAGNRIRIFNMLSALKTLGFEVHFIYDDRESSSGHVKERVDISGMKKEWDQFIYSSPFTFYFNCRFFYLISGNLWRVGNFLNILFNLPNQVTGECGWWLKKKYPRVYAWLKPYFPDKEPPLIRLNKWLYDFRNPLTKGKKKSLKRGYHQIDSWYNFRLDRVVKDLYERHHYDFVLVEYVYLSRVFENFPAEVVKVIDTHDVFTDRKGKYKDFGINETFFSTTASEEALGLLRADKIIAIQEKEADFFRTLVEKPVFTIGHLIERIHPSGDNLENVILFVGTGNLANINGLNNFIDNVFPKIRSRVDDCRLIVAGNVCKFIYDRPGVERVGEVASLDAVYRGAKVVINPTNIGTGLKIKNIECLSYSKPLVVSRHSAEGMEFFKDAILVAENDEDFADKVVKILSDPKEYSRLLDRATPLIRAYNTLNVEAINRVFT